MFKLKKLAIASLIAGTLAIGIPVGAQITRPYVFSTGPILASEVNANFAQLANDALDRTGGTITGTIAVDSGITIDGFDLGVTLLVAEAKVTDSNATQTINDSTWTTVTFDTEDWDTDTMHSTVSNTGRLTATTAGTYISGCGIAWDTNTTGRRAMRILANGSTDQGRIMAAAGASTLTQQVTGHIQLTAAQYIECQVWQDSGGARTIVRDGGVTPKFWMTRR